jgi:hypothetical protein
MSKVLSYALERNKGNQPVRKENTDMMNLVVGTAVLVPSLYWSAIVAASVKAVVKKDN